MVVISSFDMDKKPPNIFNSKLLLFGEYGLMYDAMALSVPFPKFSGFLDFDQDYSHSESTSEIQKLFMHLKSENSRQNLRFPFDLESLENDLSKGLYFNSSIPQQYGLGSSGALVAALFSRYASSDEENEFTPEILKTDFALLESFFHGRSSGLDPLTSYLNKPLLIDSEKMVRKLDFDRNKSNLAIALIDTKITGETGLLVKHFIEQNRFPEFKEAFKNQFLPANNGCIESFLNREHSQFFMNLEALIRFQLANFRRMIPEGFQDLIAEAIEENVFIKLLGSGGGGFLLAFAQTETTLEQWAAMKRIELLKVN